MKKKIIAVLLILTICTSICLSISLGTGPLYASSISPPNGWVFAETNQRIKVTLNGITYYAYELKKTTSNTPGGWLITDSNDGIVYDSDTYQKLALTATVSKTVNDSSFITNMESELNLLKSIKWRIDLYETATFITKLVTDISAARTGLLLGTGFAEELIATGFAPLKSREGNLIQDALFSAFSKDFVSDATDRLSKALEIIGKSSELPQVKWLKIFGILSTVLRREAASFARGGYDAYQSAYEIVKKNRTSWSYEEASTFLNKYKEGRTRGLPFAKWYLTLIPHSENQLENIGNALWNNIGKELLSSFGLKFAVTDIDAGKFALDFIKRSFADNLISADLSKDIQNASSIFVIYRLYYDVSISGSIANQIYGAIKEAEELAVKDKTIYKTGDRVKATDYLNVRESASESGKIITTVNKGEVGTIVSSYVIADGYRWWTVKWDSGPQGWCAGEFLKPYVKFQSKKVLIVAESLPVYDRSPAGKALIGGGCKEGENCYKVLSTVHAGDLLEYIETDIQKYTPNMYLSFPGCKESYKVKDKNGNVGWVIGKWGGIWSDVDLARVIDEPVEKLEVISFPNLTGVWSGKFTRLLSGESNMQLNIKRDSMLTFSGTSTVVMDNKTISVEIRGAIFKNEATYLEYYPDGTYVYCSGTVSSDRKTIEGWKNSYDWLAIPLGPFKVTFKGGQP